MEAKEIAKTLATVVLSAALALNLNAEVFGSTYNATQCQNYELITEMLIGPGVARHPSGAKIPQTNNAQIGVFSNLVAQAESVSSFTNGVILSTGKIIDGPSLKNESATFEWADEALPNLGYDADLNGYFGENLSDPAGIILYIQPKNTTINIPFVMASEEFYYEPVSTPSVDLPEQEAYQQYSDKFAFFLKELGDAASVTNTSGEVVDDGSPMTVDSGGTEWWNVAKLPNENGDDVEIASVNQHTNSNYFISNVVSNEYGELVFPATDISLPMEFNGAIVGPIAVATGLDTNKIYKLKIVIGDSYDNLVNSVVFLRERGITSGADLKVDVEGPTSMTEVGQATFTDTVSNIGPVSADGVEVKHYLPEGVDAGAVVIEPSVGSIGGFVVEDESTYFVWNIGDGFAPGATASMTITCTLPNAGVYTNIATVATSTGDYDETNNTDDVVTTVGELPKLTVAAINTNMVYGTNLQVPDLQFILSIDGTNETQVVSGIDVSFTNALGEVVNPATAPVGTYSIVLSNIQGFSLSAFGGVIYVPGLLTVEKAPLTITARDQTKEYGEAFAFAGTEFDVTGTLKNSDAVTSATLASEGAAATAPHAAAGYPITVSGAVGTGLSNYEITYVPGTLTVTKRALEITARNQPKDYGEELVFVGDEFLVTSGELASGDAVTSVTLASEGAAAAAPYVAAGYPITASDAVGTGLANYEITYVDGTLTITKRVITITANDAEKEYGEAKTFDGSEFTVTGDLQNGDQVTSVAISGVMATNVAASVGVHTDDIAPYYPVLGIDTNNYNIVFSNGTLTVTQAVLTITVNDATWKAGKPKPNFSFADFSAQLKGGDTIADVTGGAGAAADVTYTNVVWNASEPTAADAGDYPDEIWIDVASVDGARAENYVIEIIPGTLTVTDVEAELKTTISASLNWNTGLLDLTLTIKNEGDGEVDPDYDYWVELIPGEAGAGAMASVEKTYYIDSPTGTMPDGYDYVDLTAKVKAALKTVGNRDEVFDPDESITLTGVSVYHWKRWAPSKFLDENSFFVAGKLFNEADTNKDFAVSEAEKTAAASLLGTSSSAYLEVTRLSLLEFYHWKSADGTWK